MIDLSNEEKLLIEGTKTDYNSKKISLLLKKTNYDELMSLAKFHKLTAKFFLTIKTFQTPENVKEFFEQEYFKTLLLYKQKTGVLKEISSKFKEGNIKIIPLKGAYLMKIMPDYMRTRPMDDIDLLIQEKDSKSSIKILKNLGYKKISKTNLENYFSEYKFKRENIYIELKTKLDREIKIKPKIFFSEINLEELHFLYQVYHFSYYHGFLRLGWLLDIVKQIEKDIDLKKVEALSKQFDLEASFHITMMIIKELYGLKIKIDKSFNKKYLFINNIKKGISIFDYQRAVVQDYPIWSVTKVALETNFLRKLKVFISFFYIPKFLTKEKNLLSQIRHARGRLMNKAGLENLFRALFV